MINIHTLGPQTTDSYHAVQHLIQHDSHYHDAQVVLHDSFEEIYHTLNQYPNHFFLVPVAYQSHDNQDSWASNNYRYWDKLSIKKVFHLPTFPMILVQNLNQQNQQTVLHAATNELIAQFQNHTQQKLKLNYVTSKPLAKKEFMTGKYQYAIFSSDPNFKFPHTRIIKTYYPEMIWCLYQIKAFR